MQIIIDRHNEVLSTVLQSAEEVHYVDMTWGEQSLNQLRARGYTHWRDVLTDRDDPDSVASLYSKVGYWAPNSLDWAISAAATDDLYGFMAIGTRSKVVYHPYDGGMDLIMLSSFDRDRLMERYPDYLSPYPSGL